MSDANPRTEHTLHLPAALHYPWGQAQPEVGEWMELRPGLHWERMPLPFALNHINLWVLDDQLGGQDSWTVVDAGIAIEPIRQAWQTLWRGPLASRPLGRMLVTHMHPDHVGNAHWLIEQFSAPSDPAELWMSAADFFAAKLACRETTGYGGERAAAYFTAHGLQDADLLAKIRQRGDYYASMVPELPTAYHRLREGQDLTIGGQRWRCIAGFGHSPEHMALYSEALGVLISGDMLLPKISTNISVIDVEPQADALGLFLASIARFESLPADTLVLPSHGHPFVGIHSRVQALRDHHEARLADIRAVLSHGPTTAAELLPVLFNRVLDQHQTSFAMGEAVAHINHLWHLGEVRRERDAQGVWRFSRA
ncbi:MAG TPA: MBL fold metallo-hydrolase [Aquabacterium sp.]|nr:MBL fold metallo-hydrolase [Aquabacterium sp.]